MSKLDTWLFNQRPEIKANLTVVKEDIKFLHISQDASIRSMTPRISWRQSGKEDRTIPRICGAPNLRGCILGHTIVRSNILEDTCFVRDEWKPSKNPVYYIYKMEGLEYLQPTKKLIPEVKESEEVWITAYCPEAITVVPKKIGRFAPYRITEEYIMGERLLTNVFYLEALEDISLGKDISITAGKHQFSMDGNLEPFGKCYPIKDVKPITNQEWALLLKSIKN